MELRKIEGRRLAAATASVELDALIARCLAAATRGDASAYYDLGVAYSTGSHGAP